MSIVKNSISPLQIRPFVSPNENFAYFWSFDNQWTASPIVEDFNRDGFDDFIWIQSNYRTATNSFDKDGQSWPTYPFVYFQSNGDGTFFDNTNEVFPGGQFIGMSASRYIFEDLDGDEREDLMIIDQGYESIEKDPLVLPDMLVGASLIDNKGKPWSVEISHQGAVLSWWKGKSDGTFQRHDIKDGYMAFHHNGSAADIDLDGDKEVVIANAGTFLSVNSKAIETFLNPVPNDKLLYGGATSTRITDENILSAGFRPVIPLVLNDAYQFELNFEMLPEDGMRSIVHQNGSFRELLAVSTVELADINGDRYPEMIAGVGINYKGAPDSNRIYLNQTGKYSAGNYISLPFPKEAADPINRNSAVFIDTADFDGNGLTDIAIGYENPGNGMGAGHFIQLFKQTAPLVFKDVTIEVIGTYATRGLLDMASNPFGSMKTWGGGPSWLRFEDLNGDGHEDIAMFTQLVGFYQLGGAFLINDGTGNFAPLHHSNFSAPALRKNISYPNQNAYNYQAIYGDFDGNGLKDNLVIEYEFWGYSEEFPNSLRKPAYLFTQTELAEEPISQLANGRKIWSKANPGFNEFFYANHYPDAALALAKGEYKSLYEFYKAVGQNRGDTTVAPNTKIIGAENRVDSIELSGKRAEFELVINNASADTSLTSKTWGSLKLNNIERLSFTDICIALDTQGVGGQTAKILGSVFGKASVSNKEYAGIGIDLLDKGISYEMLLDLALTVALRERRSDESVVNLLYTNLVGNAPSQAELKDLIGLIQSGNFTQVSLARFASDHVLNTINIDLVGLSKAGLEYIAVV